MIRFQLMISLDMKTIFVETIFLSSELNKVRNELLLSLKRHDKVAFKRSYFGKYLARK